MTDPPNDAPRTGEPTAPVSESPVSVSSNRRRKPQPHHRPAAGEAALSDGPVMPYGWPPILTMRLAVAYTGLSSTTIKRAVAAERLCAAGRCGRTLTFLREALDAYLLGQTADQTAHAPAPATSAPAAHRYVKPGKVRHTGAPDDLALDRLRRLAKGGAR
jgi:hypothetical protein